jgi:hypothetical protein
MGARVGEQGQNLEVLEERTGPAVGQEEGQRRRTITCLQHQVNSRAFDVGTKVIKLIETRLEFGRVKSAPVDYQFLEPPTRRPTHPRIGIGLWGEATRLQASSEIAQRDAV